MSLLCLFVRLSTCLFKFDLCYWTLTAVMTCRLIEINSLKLDKNYYEIIINAVHKQVCKSGNIPKPHIVEMNTKRRCLQVTYICVYVLIYIYIYIYSIYFIVVYIYIYIYIYRFWIYRKKIGQ